MANKYFKVVVFLAFFIVANNVYAPPPPPPPISPIDGGIIYLIIGAVSFGLKKLWDKNRKN